MLLFCKLRGMWPLLLAGGAFFSSSWAAVTLPPCFSDHMVLQRELPVAVWGLAEPGESVSVSFIEQTKSTRADSEGNWQLHLDPLEAGGPHTMTVKASNTITFKDVLVGEVWLGAGQSNMEYPSGSELFLKDTRLAEIMAAAPYPDIRIMNWNGQWTPATPESIPNFSALLFSFGHRLQPELGVPLGLIAAGRGSTPSGTWLTPAMIEADATCQAQVEAFKQSHTPETLRAQYAKQRADWEKEVEKRLKAGRHAPPEPVPLEPGDFQTRKVYRIFPLGVHYRERVEPFAGLTLRAIL